MPNYEEYLRIFDIISQTKHCPEYNLFSNPSEEQLKELIKQKVQQNRTVLAEWLKFSSFMNLDEELTKNMMVNKLSEFISSMKYTYDDYIHLLEPKRFLLEDSTGEPLVGVTYRVNDTSVSHVEFQTHNDMIDCDIQIKSFTNLNPKMIEEYNRNFDLDEIVRDADDCCVTAVNVLQLLLADQKQDFKEIMLKSIIDIHELLAKDENSLQ